MNPDQGTELRSGRVINSSSKTSSPIDPDMAQSSANDSDNNETSDISSQLSEIRENYEKKINELQSEFSQLKNLLMAVISKTDENNRPPTSQSSSKPAHTVGFDNITKLKHEFAKRIIVIQSLNNFALFTHISYICYIYLVNQIRDILVGCESNVDDVPSLDFRFNIFSHVINIYCDPSLI